MAKGTKKKAGAKARMPKTVAGVKVPKEVRDFGGGIGSWLNTHLGREILAEALVAAAGAAALALRKHAPTPQQVRRARRDVVATGAEAAAKTKDAVQSAVGAVSDVVAGVAQKLMPEAAAPAAAETPAPRRRGRPKSVKPAEAAAAAPAPRRRGPRAGRPAGAGPGRPRKPRGAASEPTTEGPNE